MGNDVTNRSSDVVAALGSDARARHDEFEATRRVPEDLDRRAAEAGLFRQLVPEELGGLGRTPSEWFGVGIELARAEPSFSWVVTQGAAGMAWLVAGGHPEWVRTVLSDEHAEVASSFAGTGTLTPTNGRFRFEGRWDFGTGCHGATWVGGLAAVVGEEPGLAKMRWALVPAGRARLEETWDPIGMVGTGSDTIVVDAQDVPAEWTFSSFVPSPFDRGPISVAVGNGNWPIATSVAAVQLGTARLALDLATEVLPAKRPAPNFVPLSTSAFVQRRLMHAEATWAACRAGVADALGALWEEAQRDGRLSSETRVRLLLANAHANRSAVEVVDSCCELVGTSMVPARGLMGACLRNAHTLLGHVSANGATLEFAGQVSLGLIDEHLLV